MSGDAHGKTTMTEFPAGHIGDHVPRMYRVALRIIGDAEAAQDAVQDACVKALRGMRRFDGRSSLSTWLHRITVNCAIDRLRDRQGGGRTASPAELAGLSARPDTTPADRAEFNEIYRMAVERVAQLPDDCRRAFVLTQLDGYSYDEAALIEQQPRGTIASRVFRAKRILLDELSSRLDGRTQA
jgi:RNA polymerase sigma-70 factor (ECF subfamily)